MGIKKIAPIPKTYPRDFRSLESSLAEQGFQRQPGAVTIKLPFKEYNGKYRTGLDENADYLLELPGEMQEAERARIIETRERLEKALRVDLSPTSDFYNYASDLPEGKKVYPVKLTSKEHAFNVSNPIEEVTWNWLRVHPTIAPSLSAVQNRQVNISVVQYYVADDDVENQVKFKKKQALNKAIRKLDELSPSKLRQVARLMGMPVTEDTKEEVAYNLVDTVLKDGEFGTTNEHKGHNPITLFNELLALDEQRAHVKDIVAEAIKTSIYRRRGDKIMEGENEVAASPEELVNYLLQDKNQDDLLALEKKLKINKIASV